MNPSIRLRAAASSVREMSPGAELPYVALEHVESGTGRFVEGFKPQDKATAAEILFRRGDVLFGKLRPYLAKVVAPDFDGCASGEFIVLRPAPSTDHRFLYHLCLSRPFLDWANATSAGTKMPRTDWEQLSSFPFGLPPRERQREIADFLDHETARIDELVRRRVLLAELLSERFRAIQGSYLLRGIDPTAGGTTDLPSGWRLVRLASVMRLQRGHDLPDQKRRDGSVPIVSSGGVTGYHAEARAMGPGIVTGRYGTVGEVYWAEGPYWPLNTSLYVIDFKGNDPRWAFHLLRVAPLDIDAEKSAVTGVNRNVIGQLRVPLPPVVEQRRISAELDSAEVRLNEVGARIRRHIGLLRERRQALITAGVTGQLAAASPSKYSVD